MDCADCEAAAARLHYGFQSQCSGCVARSVARGPSFRRVQQAGLLDLEYLALLETMGVSHEAVKAASAADWLTKRRRGTLPQPPVFIRSADPDFGQ